MQVLFEITTYKSSGKWYNTEVVLLEVTENPLLMNNFEQLIHDNNGIKGKAAYTTVRCIDEQVFANVLFVNIED